MSLFSPSPKPFLPADAPMALDEPIFAMDLAQPAQEPFVLTQLGGDVPLVLSPTAVVAAAPLVHAHTANQHVVTGAAGPSPSFNPLLLSPNRRVTVQHIVVAEENEYEIRIAQQRERVCVADFELLSVVGRGAYGKVFQVRKHSNGKIYAMKVLRKDQIKQPKDISHTIAERQILEVIQNPFVVSLRYAFQTDAKLYFILDYISGGELFARLDEQGTLSEADTRFYAAEVIVALEHLHQENIIYRDLKPENILLGSDGHICLTDFGFSKTEFADSDVTRTFCGTIHYMAPEIVTKTGHGKGADWWALGCLIFEMLTGRTPFHASNRKQIQQNIISQKLKLPPSMTPICQSLLRALLTRTVNKRLGANGAAEIKEHPFFAGIDWADVAAKGLRPPHMPKVGDENDTSCFDKKFTSEPPIDSPTAAAQVMPIEGQHSDPFKGFSFVRSPLTPCNLPPPAAAIANDHPRQASVSIPISSRANDAQSASFAVFADKAQLMSANGEVKMEKFTLEPPARTVETETDVETASSDHDSENISLSRPPVCAHHSAPPSVDEDDASAPLGAFVMMENYFNDAAPPAAITKPCSPLALPEREQSRAVPIAVNGNATAKRLNPRAAAFVPTGF